MNITSLTTVGFCCFFFSFNFSKEDDNYFFLLQNIWKYWKHANKELHI